jgi:serine-type D-Ala-D-Ala carboxypeptidase (penicillin-binding protein 5/6)
MIGNRIYFLAAALALSACSVVEHEQRQPPGTILRSTGTPAEPVSGVAQRPVGAPDFWPADAPAIHAKSAIMIDADSGRTLFQKNADEPRQVASTQKLLTALIIAERGDLDGNLVISASDTYVEPTKAGVRAGQTYTRRQMLNALLVHSCNDAAAALAHDAAGSTEAFASLMNARAEALGAYSSHFVNPHGLPAPQHSTARDMARIAYRAYHRPELREIIRQTFYAFRFPSGRVEYLKTTNRLLGVVPGVDGMKTGYTDAAGRCLITSATIGNRHVILVQLGSRTSYIFNDAQTMLAWAAAR